MGQHRQGSMGWDAARDHERGGKRAGSLPSCTAASPHQTEDRHRAALKLRRQAVGAAGHPAARLAAVSAIAAGLAALPQACQAGLAGLAGGRSLWPQLLRAAGFGGSRSSSQGCGRRASSAVGQQTGQRKPVALDPAARGVVHRGKHGQPAAAQARVGEGASGRGAVGGSSLGAHPTQLSLPSLLPPGRDHPLTGSRRQRR